MGPKRELVSDGRPEPFFKTPAPMHLFDEYILEIIPYFHGEHCHSECPVDEILFRIKILLMSQNEFNGYCV